MATLRDIRRRISGVKSTEKITKAMKMVAAAKLRRAQDAIVQARPYAGKMAEMLHHLSTKVDVSQYPLIAERPVQSVAVVVVTADRGMCGAFNTNIIRAATQRINAMYAQLRAEGKVKVICVGKKGYEYFSKHKFDIVLKHVGIFNALKFADARAIVTEIVESFGRHEFDRVEAVYNEFKSAVQQRVAIEQFLPIVRPETQNGETKGASAGLDYIYEPASEEIISALVPKHLNFQMWRVLLESNAAEQGARMLAMENASTNAKEIINDLTLSYNKARQASITKELLEIVSGAEALQNG
ncbi:MAG: ATP synthase F1 subunit gamma [Bacteroidota bacterium]|nr:ATP synthase F1 subunit gamma [Bacteroidota bacterium]